MAGVFASEACAHQFPLLEQLVERAAANHPRLAELDARARQAVARYEQVYGFLDPALRAAAGASDDVRSVPGLDEFGSISSQAYEIQGSLEIPFRPGFYLGIGLTERYFYNPDDFDSLYQNLVGAGIRIPLLQDRGFALWQLDRLLKLAEFDRVVSECLNERQILRHDVEQAFFSVCESIAIRNITREATARYESLLTEAESLVEHNAIAEYEVLAPKTELELNRAEDLRARQDLEIERLKLKELTGAAETPDVQIEAGDWLSRTDRLKLTEQIQVRDCLLNRGDYLAASNDRLVAELAVQRAEEFLKGDMSLRAAATWEAEDQNTPLGSNASEGGNNIGGHVMLVYSVPLGHRSEKARIAELSSRIAELDARLRIIELAVRRDLHISRTTFEFARKRYQEATRAVESAGRNLNAEQERFRLGEARSRHVLDAQNDVTRARRAQVVAAAELMGAWSDHQFAAGYPSRAGLRDGLDEMKPAKP